jgi:hypothetical protein
MCGGCFGDYEDNTQLALHLAAEKMRRLYACTRAQNAAVDAYLLLSSSPASSSSAVLEVVSVQAADAANADVADAVVAEAAGAAAATVFVLTSEQIAACHQAVMKMMAAEREAEQCQIIDSFKTCLAFVRNISKTCTRPVTQRTLSRGRDGTFMQSNKTS